jgi:uncharacterized lipoprotein YajG
MTQPQTTPTLPRKKDDNGCALLLVVAFIVFFLIVGKNTKSVGSYVAPYHTRRGKMVKGHARKNISTDVNAVQHRNYSKGYHYLHKSRYKHK